MANLLSLFIHQPFSLWEREYNYGEPLVADAGVTADHVGLSTAEPDVFLFAACGGELSVGAPIYTPVKLEELPDPPDSSWLPETVDLCLMMNPLAHAVTDFAGESLALPIDVVAFIYRNVDVASLMEDLREPLRWSTVPPADENIDDDELARRMSLFLNGMLSVYVDAGQRLGQPGAHPDPGAAQPRHVGFGVMTSDGAWNPGDAYDRLRTLVEEQSDVDDFLVLVPRPPNAFSGASSKSAAIALTEDALYPYTDLQTLRTDWSLTRADWRQVGDNQKALYRERLLARSGLLPAGGVEPFEFNAVDWQNLFQLEAIVEFYVNFVDPWAPGATPIDVAPPSLDPIDHATLALQGNDARISGGFVRLNDATDLSRVQKFRHRVYLAATDGEHWYTVTEVDAGQKRVKAVDSRGTAPSLRAGTTSSAWRIDLYETVDFVPLEGVAATITGNQVTLDGSPNLSRIKTRSTSAPDLLCDGILFESAPDRMYRIVATDPEASTVQLTEAPDPAVGLTAAWRILHVPTVVQIDAFGPREGLSGKTATVNGSTVSLSDPVPKLDKVSPGGFDTVWLPGDTARRNRTYRILQIDDTAHTVTLDGSPTLAGGTSGWAIPAGVGGTLPSLNYKLKPGTQANDPKGFDHYDGAMFVIDDGTVTEQIRFTSYTSRKRDGANRRSILGNHRYDVASFTSTNAYKNYSFAIRDRSTADNVFDSRAYFDTPVTTGGQQQIRLHDGNPTGTETGSAGCNVSPNYYSLRAAVINAFQRRHRLMQGPGGASDAAIERVGACVTAEASKALWSKSQPPPPPPAPPPPPVPADEQVLGEAWTARILCHYWLIRPDERPAGP